jgi:hypothetical protein
MIVTLIYPLTVFFRGRDKPIPYVFLADDAFAPTRISWNPMQERKKRGRRQEYAATGSAEDGVSPKMFLELCPKSFGFCAGNYWCNRTKLLQQFTFTTSWEEIHRDTHTPLGIFDAECPDAGELRLGNWRSDHETRLGDFPRFARKSAIKAARARERTQGIFLL